VTDVAALIVTLHVPVPVQPPPLQPVNVEPRQASSQGYDGTARETVDRSRRRRYRRCAGELPLPAPDFGDGGVNEDCTNVAVTPGPHSCDGAGPGAGQPPPLQP